MNTHSHTHQKGPSQHQHQKPNPSWWGQFLVFESEEHSEEKASPMLTSLLIFIFLKSTTGFYCLYCLHCFVVGSNQFSNFTVPLKEKTRHRPSNKLQANQHFNSGATTLVFVLDACCSRLILSYTNQQTNQIFLQPHTPAFQLLAFNLSVHSKPISWRISVKWARGILCPIHTHTRHWYYWKESERNIQIVKRIKLLAIGL